MALLFPNTPRQPTAVCAALGRAFVFTAQTAICLLMPAAVHPQTAPTPPTPKFEVASIRPVPPDRFPKVFYQSPSGSDQFVLRNATLSSLLSWAYSLIDARQLPNAPGWFNTANWDITAKPEGAVRPDDKTLKLLVQQLLQDRFHFTYHTRTEVVKGYRLITAKDGSRLTTSKGGAADASAAWNSVDTRIYVRNSPLSGLASVVMRVLHEPVVDATGLDGNYDVILRVATLDSTESTSPSIFSALSELGLKLEKANIPLQILMMDDIERFPTEN